MHENQGNSVIFYSHYTEGGVSKTGLTVTVDVYEVIRDGTATLVTNDGSCTEIGAGLYRYILAGASVDAAAEYVGVFHTATDTVDAQDLPAIWVIDRAGLEKLDSGGVPVASIATDALTAAAVKADAVTKIQTGITAEDVMTAIVEGAVTLRDSLKLANAMNAGKVSGGNTAAVTFRDLADTLDRIIMTVDVDGNRTLVVRDLT